MKKTTYMNTTILSNETGRSMVEMLGVLAIIGVLSVGGVYGYGVAMKKHKANELLHQASMLATTVSAQIMSGKDPTALDTFADSNLGKFALDYDPTKTTFDLKISELDGSVCSQLKEGGMVQKVECNETAKTASITYYKNLATSKEQGEADGSLNGSCTESSDKCDGGTYYVCENGKWVAQSGLTCNGNNVELSDSCKFDQTVCLKGTPYVCCGGYWLEYPWDKCCDGNKAFDGLDFTCKDGMSYMCCAGNWLEMNPCCEGNVPEQSGRCVNGQAQICSFGLWDNDSSVGCCNGDEFMGEGKEACVNGGYKVCCAGNWYSTQGCCNGDTDVAEGETTTINGKTYRCNNAQLRLIETCNDDGATKCMDGTYYTCFGGEWMDYGGCCYGDTAFEDREGYCKDGVYYVCSTAWWVNSNDDYVDGCCNGDDIVEEYNTTTINGKTYRCSGGQLWLYETCNVDGATKCMDGKYYTCCVGEWMNYGGCCLGDTAFEDGTYQCIAGKYRACCAGTWTEYSDCQTAGSCSTEGATSCINGTYYTCYGGVWSDTSSEGCCNGNTFVPNWQNACVDGEYKHCCTGVWMDLGTACPTGNDICSTNCITDANECQKLENLYELSQGIEGPIGLQDLGTDTWERIIQCNNFDNQAEAGYYLCSTFNRSYYSATCFTCLAECYTGLRSDITGRCIEPTEQGYFWIDEGRESECRNKGWQVIRPYEMSGSYCSSSYELTEMLDGMCPGY